MPVANAELPEDLFLAHALTKDRLIARDKDLTDPIEWPQANPKLCPARVCLDHNLGLVAHGLEQFVQTGDRPNGRPDPISFAGLDKGRLQRRDGGDQTLDAAGRIG